MILVLGSVVVAEGSLTRALALSLEHVKRSRLEPGCIAHTVHQDAENPRRLVFVEKWREQADLREHFKVSDSRDFVMALGALATEPPTLVIYQADLLPTPGQVGS